MSRTRILLPSPDTRAWERFETGPGGALRARGGTAVGDPAPGYLVGLPASASLVSAFWVPDPAPAPLAKIAATQLDRIGFTTIDGPAELRMAASEPGRNLVSAAFLPADLTESATPAGADGWTTSAAVLAHHAPDGVVIWREWGHISVAVCRSGIPIHTQVLARSQDSFQAALGGLYATLLGLGGARMLAPGHPEVVLLGEFQPEHSADATRVLGLPARIHRDRIPAPPAGAPLTPGLQPARIRARRSTFQRRARRLAAAGFAGTAIGLAALVLARGNANQERKLADLRAALERDRPEVESVQAAMARWSALAPAVDPERHPLELLLATTRALPPAGVRLTAFEVRAGKVSIRGQARNAAEVFALADALRHLPGFTHLTWKSAQPKVQKDDTADFQIEGSPANAAP